MAHTVNIINLFFTRNILLFVSFGSKCSVCGNFWAYILSHVLAIPVIPNIITHNNKY